jgi:hypothetical protein
MEGWLKDNGYIKPKDVVFEDPQPMTLISACISITNDIRRRISEAPRKFRRWILSSIDADIAASLVGAVVLLLAF